MDCIYYINLWKDGLEENSQLLTIVMPFVVRVCVRHEVSVGCGHDKPATRPQDVENVSYKRRVFLYVFKNLHGSDHVKTILGQLRCSHVVVHCFLHVAPAPFYFVFDMIGNAQIQLLLDVRNTGQVSDGHETRKADGVVGLTPAHIKYSRAGWA